MAIGAYASVFSLMRVVDNALLLPSRSWHLLPDKTLVETLQRKLGILQDSLELHRSCTGKEASLDQDSAVIERIHEVVNEADDVINNYVVDRLRGVGIELDQSTGKSLFCRRIDLLIGKFDSVIQNLNYVAKEYPERAVNETSKGTSRVSSSKKSYSTGQNIMVGFDDRLLKIMDLLTRTASSTSRQIIPIIGMGGIGKTTLARNIFNNKYVVEHFEVRIWLKVSREYSVKEVILGLEGDRILSDDADRDTDVEDLQLILHRKLFNRRCLIVMDDVWSIKAWDDFKWFFQNQNSQSRIMVTTRLSDVAKALSPHNGYVMELLDEEKSLKLFNNRAFGNGNGWCSELEEIGMRIVRKCGGLPLTLAVTGGLLANSDMSREYWELVADDMDDSFARMEIAEDWLGILFPSYSHLPVHLKPCFLYMGVFPQGGIIKRSTIIKSWVAEGIVKPERDRSLEDVAVEYLDNLIGRNLILIHKHKRCGKIKTCRVHDLLRQLCIRESRKQKLFSFPKMQKMSSYSLSYDKVGEPCFVCFREVASKRIHLDQVSVGSQSITPTIAMACDDCNSMYPRLDGSRSIRLIDKFQSGLIDEITPQTTTKLRYLKVGEGESGSTLEFASPSTISLLWNLQVFCYDFHEGDCSELLSKIWEMPQLRHVKADDQALSEPVDTESRSTILYDLQTLETIENFRFSGDVVRRIPNLKKLSVYYCGDQQLDCAYYCLDNLQLLGKLESLSFQCRGIDISLDIKGIAFPRSLKKVALGATRLLWKDMAVIASLPNLEVLKLGYDSFVGDEWCTSEGGFLRLKYLKMESLDLVCWATECSSHFPALETLRLVCMLRLQDIPSCIGDVNTLCRIYVDYSGEALVSSATQLKEEQETVGNDDLHVSIDPPVGGSDSEDDV